MSDLLQQIIKKKLGEKAAVKAPGLEDLSADAASEIMEAVKAGDSRALASSLKHFVQAVKDSD